MLVTLRNSGASNIQFTPILDDKLLLDIIEKDDDRVYKIFLKSTELDAFILDTNLKPKFLHLEVNDVGWGNNIKKRYEIKIAVSKSHYRLLYDGDQKPDFFKKLFTIFYPGDADKQVEELV